MYVVDASVWGQAQLWPMSTAGEVPWNFQTPVTTSHISISYSMIGDPTLFTAKSQSRVIEYFIFFHMSNLNGSPVGSVRLVILWKNEKNNKVKYKDLKYANEKIWTKNVEYGWLLN